MVSAAQALDNLGTIASTQGGVIVINPAGTFTNVGAITAVGGDLTVNPGTLSNYSAGTLTGGTWGADGNVLRLVGDNITTSDATIALAGIGSHIYSNLTGNNTDALANFAVNNSEFTVEGGASVTTASPFTNTSNFAVDPGSSFTVSGGGNYTQTAGVTTIGGGTLAVTTGVILINGGNLQGTGTLGSSVTVASGGTLTLGQVTGYLAVKGDLALSGTLNDTLAGTQIGSAGGYEQLDVSGNFENTGSINIASAGGFGPGPDDTFKLVEFTSLAEGGSVNVAPSLNLQPYFDGDTMWLLPSPYRTATVTTTADSGPGSLRAAIAQANTPGAFTLIAFNIPTSDSGYNSTTGVWTIAPTSALPALTNPVLLDGTTQPGKPVIDLSGTSAGASTGLTLSASHSTIEGLAINNFQDDGIDVTGGVSDTISGNYIGITASGLAAAGNGGAGVFLNSSTHSTTIGGPGIADRNVISGNTSHGVLISGTGNTVQGNYIGTDATGNAALGNKGNGVIVNVSADNNAILANVISGNTGQGVIFYDSTFGIASPAGSVVQGNIIGLGADGSTELGNGSYGIYLAIDSRDVTIGGATAADGNVISDNGGFGIITGNEDSGAIIENNKIGTDATGTLGRGGSQGYGIYSESPDGVMRDNLISDNSVAGVALAATLATGNTIAGNTIGLSASGSILANGSGILLQDASGNTVGGTTAADRNIISGNTQYAIEIYQAANNNTIEGNYIGTDATGTLARANGAGIYIASASTNNLIGGATAADRNVISGNDGSGVRIDTGASGNTVEGNYIGTDVTGNAALGNTGNNNSGAISIGSDANTVLDNVISGNTGVGILIYDATSGIISPVGSVVQGNIIGLGADGSTNLGNTNYGIYVALDSRDVTIGGATARAGNVISENGQFGILSDSPNAGDMTIENNLIGTDSTGMLGRGNQGDGILIYAPNSVIRGNLVSGNLGAGIHLFSASASGDVIAGNTIGLNAAGGILANVKGIVVQAGATGDTVGGTTAADRNIISGNTFHGVELEGATNDTVEGNYIGTDATGTLARANGANGVAIDTTATNNLIGGTTTGAGNVISGNNYGIGIDGTSHNNTIAGNLIGTNAAGTAALSNGLDGVAINGYSNTVGGTTVAARNIIAGNGSDGVDIFQSTATGNVVEGNYIGTNASGSDLLAGEAAWYQANGNANDSAGANNGTVEGGVTYAAGEVGQAFSLNGTNAYIDVPSSPSLVPSSAVSVEAWINLAALPPSSSPTGGWDVVNELFDNGNNPLPGQNQPGAGAYDLRVLSNGAVQFFVGTSETLPYYTKVTTAAGAVTAGQFFHVAGTYDSTTGKLSVYVNGVATTATASGTLNQDPIAVKIGADLFNGTYFHGLIDEPTIYDRALSSSEIQRIYQSGSLGKSNFLGNSSSGMVIQGGASGNTVGGTTAGARNVISGNTQDGVQITGNGTSGNAVEGNYIGTNAAGTGIVANSSDGVHILSGATNNTVGGLTATPGMGAGNVISGNSAFGIEIDNATSTGNVVEGNLVGPDATGKLALGNFGLTHNNGQAAIYINNATSNTIGGTTATARNVISGNAAAIGVYVQGPSNLVEGNYIGVDITGNTALGNLEGLVAGSIDNTIGGVTATPGTGAGNVISGNLGFSGVSDGGNANVYEGNLIGLGADGTTAVGNHGYGMFLDSSINVTIGGTAAGAGNVISANGDVGIWGGTGATIAGNFIGTDASGNLARGNGFEGAGQSGIYAPRDSESIIDNLISGNTGIGLTLGGIDLVQGNLIGTRRDGLAALANQAEGVYVLGANNTIGGTTAAARNVISGNVQAGVEFNTAAATGNVLEGNYIGVGSDGATAVPNTLVSNTYGYGVWLTGGASNNTIGGTTAGARNVISGNSGVGVIITVAGTTANLVEGNYIGTNAAGTSAVGNVSSGVFIQDASNNVIGGGAAGAGNVISGNAIDVEIFGVNAAAAGNKVQGNIIDADATGMNPLPNTEGYAILVAYNAAGNIIGTDSDGVNDAGERNVIAVTGTAGIFIQEVAGYTRPTGNVIAGNYVGLNAVGTAPLGAGGRDIWIQGGVNTRIGTNADGVNDAGERNVIVPGTISATGILLTPDTSGTTIAGNYIGTDPTGTVALAVPASAGIVLEAKSGSVTGTTIGGTAAAAHNVISGTSGDAVELDGAGVSGNVVEGNFLGTDATGSVALPDSNGVAVLNGASGNTIGGVAPGVQNVVTQNGLFGQVYGIAVEANGDLIASDAIHAQLVRVNPITGAQTVLSSGGNFVNPDGVTVAANGAIYVAEAAVKGGTPAIIRVDPTTAAQTVVSSGGAFVHPAEVTVAANGDIYVADDYAFGGNGAIFKVNPTTGAQTVVTQGNGSSLPGQMAFDANGDLLVVYGPFTSSGPGEVDRVNLTTGTRTAVSSGGLLSNPFGMVIGQDGSILVENTPGTTPGTGQIIRIDPTTGAQTVASSGGALGAPIELAIAPSGDLYATNYPDPLSFANPQIVRIAANAARNVISGNSGDGVLIQDAATTGNVVEGNYIGTNAAGTAAVGNNSSGAAGDGGIIVSAGANTIGGTAGGSGNLISGNNGNGILFSNAAPGSLVEGNRIGTNAAGTAAVANGGGIGLNFASGEIIGGTTAAARNIISGNTVVGIDLNASSNVVIEGNWIGTNAAGTAALGSTYGILTNADESGDVIGGTAAGAGNVIAGNSDGIALEGTGVSNFTIQGNLIGTDPTGTTAIPNVTGILDSINGITIGGTAAEARNIISGNSLYGVEVGNANAGFPVVGGSLEGNYIGTDISGSVALPNAGDGIRLEFGTTNFTVGGAAAPVQQALVPSTGLTNPLRLVRTTSGALYLDDQTTNIIYRMDPVTGALTVFSSGGLLTSIGAMAYDPSTNALIVANYDLNTNTGSLIRISLATGTQTTLTSGQYLNLVEGIAVMPNGHYLVSSYSNQSPFTSQIVAVDPTTGAQTPIGGSIAGEVDDMAVSSTGKIYLSHLVSFSPSFVSEILGLDPTNGTTTVISNGGDLVYLSGLTVQADGSLVAAVQVPPSGGGPSPGQLVKVDPNTGAQTIITSGGNLIDTVDVVAEPNGDMLAVNGLFHPAADAVVRVLINPARNVISGNSKQGVDISASTGNTVEGNFIGANADGIAALPNGANGVLIENASSGNTVGGTAAGAGNLIAGNLGRGVWIDATSSSNVIQGNKVGTDTTGTVALGNGLAPNFASGIRIEGANNTVGGTAAGAGNLVSANGAAGVRLTGTGATGNLVEGNLIGTDITGTVALGNQPSGGVLIESGASGNTIGGTTASARNVISGNSGAGVSIAATSNLVEGNYIGTTASGTAALGNVNWGVLITGANNTVGGTVAGAANVVSANQYGVTIQGGLAVGNVVQGNFIGTDKSGSVALGNTVDGAAVIQGAGRQPHRRCDGRRPEHYQRQCPVWRPRGRRGRWRQRHRGQLCRDRRNG